MFIESYALPSHPVESCDVSLQCVWNVHADASYDVSINTSKRVSASLRPRGGTGLVAVRTRAGRGRVYLHDGSVFGLQADSLLLIEWPALLRYHCHGDAWDFWWFEFSVHGPLPAPVHVQMQVPSSDSDAKAFENILNHLRRQDTIYAYLASAEFQVLFYRWMTRRTDRADRPAHFAAIQAIITQMQERLDGTFSVKLMARKACMSEQHFRRVFHEVTGNSPKRFYDQLRMAWAEHMLRGGGKNVSEVADSLGFSSPFHFSRVFRKHFGYPPSRIPTK